MSISKRGRKECCLNLSEERYLEKDENEICWCEEILKKIVELIILAELYVSGHLQMKRIQRWCMMNTERSKCEDRNRENMEWEKINLLLKG